MSLWLGQASPPAAFPPVKNHPNLNIMLLRGGIKPVGEAVEGGWLLIDSFNPLFRLISLNSSLWVKLLKEGGKA